MSCGGEGLGPQGHGPGRRRVGTALSWLECWAGRQAAERGSRPWDASVQRLGVSWPPGRSPPLAFRRVTVPTSTSGSGRGRPDEAVPRPPLWGHRTPSMCSRRSRLGRCGHPHGGLCMSLPLRGLSSWSRVHQRLTCPSCSHQRPITEPRAQPWPQVPASPRRRRPYPPVLALRPGQACVPNGQAHCAPPCLGNSVHPSTEPAGHLALRRGTQGVGKRAQWPGAVAFWGTRVSLNGPSDRFPPLAPAWACLWLLGARASL